MLKKKKYLIKKRKFSIIVAEFYSQKSALLLKERINKELPNYDIKKLHIKAKKTNKISLLSGPYKSINSMKNDYIELINFGFEELDIAINE
jgi:CRISPR/Cas system-associated protein endoribonuclease Cas2